MKRVLLDTNGFSALARGDAAVLAALSEADVVYLSAVVLGELRAGFKGGAAEKANREALQRFLERPTVRTLAVTPDTAEVYASVKHALKQAGTPIPINDVWICAHALEIGAVVITDDAHFDRVPGVRVWVRDGG
jgi:tRNA(fMet)-specific endonuclease VapC